MKMQNAEMEFVAFDAQDVIATSGGGNPTLKLSGYENGVPRDLKFEMDDMTYTDFDSLNEALWKAERGHDMIYMYGDSSQSIQIEDILFQLDGLDEDFEHYSSYANGIYEWIAANNRWEHKQ